MIHLAVRPAEVGVLRYVIEAALHSISEAHADDHSQLRALLERLEAAVAGPITSQNAAWGFRGTIGSDALFDEAARELMRRFGVSADEARDLLDAPIGRHMADQHRTNEGGDELIARLCGSLRWTRQLQKAIREVRAR